MTTMAEWPRTADNDARDMPVLPDVPSTTIPPVRERETAMRIDASM